MFCPLTRIASEVERATVEMTGDSPACVALTTLDRLPGSINEQGLQQSELPAG